MIFSPGDSMSILLDPCNCQAWLASSANQADSAQRILVAEDDADLRRLYSEVLTRDGYRVDTAENGEAAWEALQAVNSAAEGYDLLITDNNMPNLTGIELIQKLRTARMTLPVIMASGTSPLNSDWLNLAAILEKPVSLDDLANKVGEVLHWSTVMVNRTGQHLDLDNGHVANGEVKPTASDPMMNEPEKN